MEDSRTLNKVIFINNTSVALVVSNIVDDKINILFASQYESTPDNLKVKLTQLLTDGANFLGFNIKSANVIFNDTELSMINYYNQVFADCSTVDDVKNEIYKKAKIDNYYVNDIVFDSIKFDEAEFTCKASYKICACNYTTYKGLISIVKQCNVSIKNTANTYTLLNRRNVGKEMSIDLVDGKNVVCQYLDGKLVSCQCLDINFNDLKLAIGLKYDLSIEQVDQALKLANLVSNNDQDTNVVMNLDFLNGSINFVKAKDFVNEWRNQLYNQIFKQIGWSDYTNVNIISQNKIDAIGNFDFYKNTIVGLENISLDNAVCLNNLDKLSNKDKHYSFETKISKAISELPA